MSRDSLVFCTVCGKNIHVRSKHENQSLQDHLSTMLHNRNINSIKQKQKSIVTMINRKNSDQLDELLSFN